MTIAHPEARRQGEDAFGGGWNGGADALQEFRALLDAVGARGSDPTQIPLFPPAGSELRIELAALQQQELIRALAELLLHAAADAHATAQGGTT